MPHIKLTKHELRLQQLKLQQLEKYLPTLQLKKSLLQQEVQQARKQIKLLEQEFETVRLAAVQCACLLTQAGVADTLRKATCFKAIKKKYHNIAGVEVPEFEDVTFESFEYSLFTTPIWFETVQHSLKELMRAKAKVLVLQEKKQALQQELTAVSIRVNLFEKNLIPKAKQCITHIKVFLNDQLLSGIAQAKVAKGKTIRKEQEDAV